MAFIRLKNHSCQFLPAKRATRLWLIQNGHLIGSKADRKFLEKVERIYLAEQSAPPSYLDMLAEQSRDTRQIALPYKDD